MMGKLTRRELLLYLGAGLSTVTLNQLLAACGIKPNTGVSPSVQPTSLSQVSTPTPFQAAATTTTITATTNAESAPTPTSNQAATQAQNPDLVVARGGQPEAMVRQAISALGGMQRFVPRGANVIIKPNI